MACFFNENIWMDLDHCMLLICWIILQNNVFWKCLKVLTGCCHWKFSIKFWTARSGVCFGIAMSLARASATKEHYWMKKSCLIYGINHCIAKVFFILASIWFWSNKISTAKFSHCFFLRLFELKYMVFLALKNNCVSNTVFVLLVIFFLAITCTISYKNIRWISDWN